MKVDSSMSKRLQKGGASFFFENPIPALRIGVAFPNQEALGKLAVLALDLGPSATWTLFRGKGVTETQQTDHQRAPKYCRICKKAFFNIKVNVWGEAPCPTGIETISTRV